jgi:predicted nucleotidyltransferase
MPQGRYFRMSDLYMPTRQEVDRVLGIFAIQLKKLLGDKLESVILFGSYARGDFTEGSDVDVMVLLNIPHEMVNDYFDDICKISAKLGLDNDMFISAIDESAELF